MVVQDPNFWRRFSTAVHQDDFEKGSPDIKHSYVDPSPTCTHTPAPSAPMSPTSQCQLFTPPSAPQSPVFAPSGLRSSVVSMPLPPPPPSAQKREQVWSSEEMQQRRASSSTTTTTTKHQQKSSKLKKSASRASTRPLLHHRATSSLQLRLPLTEPSPIHTTTLDRPNPPFHHHQSSGFHSPSALSLSGRPRTMFKTWTTITGPANIGPHSDSWLASQKKKSRQRTWICWCFWLGLIVVVAGVVAAILILRREGILKF